MDGPRFDTLARSLAARPSRRGIVRAAAGIALGALTGLRHRPASADHCPTGYFHCGGTGGECCPFFDGVCCGFDDRICCGPNDVCFRPGGDEAPVCQAKCGLNEFRCGGGAGNCCPFFGGVCCGEGDRICCNPNDICDRQTGGPPTCATPCDLFSRRCATTGLCCPYGQKCCGTDCCYPGAICSQNTICKKAKPRRKRRRRRRRH